MRRRSLVVPGLALLGLLLAGCHWHQTHKTSVGTAAPAVGVEVGQQAPDLDGEDLNGARLHLAGYRGRVVVLHFWSNA